MFHPIPDQHFCVLVLKPLYVKLSFLTGSSAREEFNRSEAFEPNKKNYLGMTLHPNLCCTGARSVRYIFSAINASEKDAKKYNSAIYWSAYENVRSSRATDVI